MRITSAFDPQRLGSCEQDHRRALGHLNHGPGTGTEFNRWLFGFDEQAASNRTEPRLSFLHRNPNWYRKSVAGLYLSPPVNAAFLSGDERSQIQARSRYNRFFPSSPTLSEGARCRHWHCPSVAVFSNTVACRCRFLAAIDRSIDPNRRTASDLSEGPLIQDYARLVPIKFAVESYLIIV